MKKETVPTEDTTWYVYMVRCADRSLYTGITTDLLRRISEHNSSRKGARYTRSRQPVTLVYSESTKSRSLASQREYHLKKLSALQKQRLINSQKSKLTP